MFTISHEYNSRSASKPVTLTFLKTCDLSSNLIDQINNDNNNDDIIDSVISHAENSNYHVYDLDPFINMINQLRFRIENNNINNIHPIFDIAGNDISNIFNRENNDEDNITTDYDNNDNDILDLSNLSDISLSSLNITNLNN